MKNINSKKRVLNIACGLSTEGIGTFLVNIYDNIDKENIEIDFALSTKYTQYYEDKIKKSGGKVYRTYEIGDGLIGVINHFVSLIKIIKKEGPFDVVHTHMDFFNGINLLAAYIGRVPKRISHAHISSQNNSLSFAKKVYYKLMKILINIFATEKIGCSNDANIYLNSEPGKIIYNGINLDKFYSNSDAVVHDINIDSDKINLITIGRIENQKNPLFIVEIVNELSSIREDIHLYWIGTGSMEAEVKSLVKKYSIEKYISFLGRRSDISSILKNVDYMIFPSKYEGLGIVLIEAQVSNVPCFISDVIPNEADLGLCTKLSLDEGAKNWAININNYINNQSYNYKLDNEKVKKFDINNVSRNMENIYLE